MIEPFHRPLQDMPPATALRRRQALALGTAMLATGAGLASAADGYPLRAVTLVVPFPPGGPADHAGRLVGRTLSEHLGQPVVIDNRPGASASIGTEHVARAQPDGYTLLLGTLGTHALNLATMPELRYDPVRDFVALAAVCATTYVVLAHPQTPYRTLEQLVAYSQRQPGAVNVALAGGPGTANALAGDLLQKAAAMQWTAIAYKGNAPALKDLLAGTVDVMLGFPGEALAHVRAGRLRALAVTHEKRLADYPDTPTVAEKGYKEAGLTAWFGVFAPANTPKAIVDRLTDSLDRAVNSPQARQALDSAGLLPYPASGPEFERIVQRDALRWGRGR